MKKNITSSPPKGWEYVGDINIEYGGYFYRVTKWGYADVVEIYPCSDAGGQDNAWWVSQGSLSIEVSEYRLDGALDCIGFEGEATNNIKVEALYSYLGFDRDCSDTVQIGPDDPYARDPVKPTLKLRTNASLENFVRKWASWA